MKKSFLSLYSMGLKFALLVTFSLSCMAISSLYVTHLAIKQVMLLVVDREVEKTLELSLDDWTKSLQNTKELAFGDIRECIYLRQWPQCTLRDSQAKFTPFLNDLGAVKLENLKFQDNEFGIVIIGNRSSDQKLGSIDLSSQIKLLQEKIESVQNAQDTRRHLSYVVPDIQSSTLYLSSLIVGIIFFITLLLTWILIRSIVRKYNLLLASLQEISTKDGKLNEALLVGTDDVSVIARSIDGMLSRISLTDAALAYSQKIASWQNFARYLAHEIMNPLTPVQLMAEEILMISESKRDNQLTRINAAASLINSETKNLTRLVSEFSRFARTPEPILKSTRLQYLLDSFKTKRDLIDTSDLDVHLDLNPELCVSIDQDMIYQVLNNLIKNSENASAPKRAKVSISIGMLNSGVHIFVKDFGPGIPDFLKDRVFEPGVSWSAPEATHKSSGFGLAICRQILLEHKGSIELASSDSGGTVFRIYLPLVGAIA
ncbi:MAG: ATP-binding protein [Proteobacteria bacterium]|nr:ATP-binding protein [Pseudomonadota bacterium]